MLGYRDLPTHCPVLSFPNVRRFLQRCADNPAETTVDAYMTSRQLGWILGGLLVGLIVWVVFTPLHISKVRIISF